MDKNAIMIFQIVISAMLGASLGSFFNVVAHRSIEGRPWWGRERSVCESCGKELTTIELIPIVSWLIQRGRCRGCGAPVSPRYFIVEVIGAAGLALMAWRWGPTWGYLLAAVGVFGFLVNALTDFESGDVFDAFAIAMGVCGMALRIGGGMGALIDGLIGALVGWGIFAVIILVSRGGMGWGDACLMAGAGAVLGWKMNLLAFYFGIMAAGFAIAILMLRGKVKWGRHDSVPLVPYLAIGGFITMLVGPQVLLLLGQRFGWNIQAGWPWF